MSLRFERAVMRILLSLGQREPLHAIALKDKLVFESGWGIDDIVWSLWVRATFYPMMYKLEDKGLVTRKTENGHTFYRATTPRKDQ